MRYAWRAGDLALPQRLGEHLRTLPPLNPLAAPCRAPWLSRPAGLPKKSKAGDRNLAKRDHRKGTKFEPIDLRLIAQTQSSPTQPYNIHQGQPQRGVRRILQQPASIDPQRLEPLHRPGVADQADKNLQRGCAEVALKHH